MHFGILQVANGPYAWLRQTNQFHHQAPIVCKQNSSHLHSLFVGILFNPTTLSIHWCKTSQLYNFNSRRGNEIFRFGVSLYKGHWCSVSCSSWFFFLLFGSVTGCLHASCWIFLHLQTVQWWLSECTARTWLVMKHAGIILEIVLSDSFNSCTHRCFSSFRNVFKLDFPP